MSFWRQLRVLLWKNFLLKRRKWYLSVVELILPLVLSLILVIFRFLSPAPIKPFAETLKLAQPLPSAGLSVLASALCPNQPDWGASNYGIPVYRDNKMNEFLRIVNALSTENSSSAWDRMDDFMRVGPQIDDFLLKARSENHSHYSVPVAYDDLSQTFFHVKLSGSENRNTNSSTGEPPIPIDYGAIVLEVLKVVVCGESNSLQHFNNNTKSHTKLHADMGDPNFDIMKILELLWNRGPKILYAPSNSAPVREIIYKANATFRMLEDARNMAVNVSVQLSGLSDEHMADLSRRLISLQRLDKSKKPRLSFKEDDPEKIRQMMCLLRHWLQNVNLDIFRGFETSGQIDAFRNKAYTENVTVVAGVIFDVDPSAATLPKHTTFTIRQNASLTTTTRAYRNLFQYPGPRYWDQSYYTYGFLFLQDLIERAIVDYHANDAIREPGTFMQFIPYPCYFKDQFLKNIESVFALAVVLSYLFSCALLVENIVIEKEHRLKDVMHSMGMNTAVLWFSWFLTQFVVSTVASALLSLLLYFGSVLSYSNPFIIFLILELFGISTILLSFLISTFFSRTKLATACGGIIFFISFLPFLYVTIREMSTSILLPSWIKIVSSISSTTALGLAMRYILFQEMKGSGSQFSNIFESPLDSTDDFCIFYVIIMLVADSFIYLILTFYIEAIIPGHSGLSKPWYFPLMTVWRKLVSRNMETLHTEEMSSSQLNDNERGAENFESLPDFLVESEPTIKIRGLFKRFKSGVRKYAVYDMNLDMYRDEIVVFLGHNGAGKTTTMNMITGLTSVTAGKIEVNGIDSTNTSIADMSLGICPQHNVLFDRLTVLEHLQFYSFLKSKSPDTLEMQTEIDMIISDLELQTKRNSNVADLSGGMKRRLSIAISFVAGSRAVILDEPTAGVDPYARRAIWDLILKYKKGRTIMISTHFMDEAELLGDRIAVMSDGQLKAVGSPLFLLKNFGDGYSITFLKENKVRDEPMEEPEFRDALVAFMESIGPSPLELKKSWEQITFRLNGWTTKQMVRMFEALKSNDLLDRLNISSYGVSDGNLEDVFLKLGASEYSEKNNEEFEENGVNDDFEFPAVRSRNTGVTLHWQRFAAQFCKRFWCLFRNRKTIVSQLILPAIFVAVGMSIALPAVLLSSYPAIPQTTFQFSNISDSPTRRSTVFYENLATDLREPIYDDDKAYLHPNVLVESLYNPSGLNAECLINNADSVWMDANYPQNRRPQNLNRTLEEDMFANSCRYHLWYNESFRPSLDYFSLPPYLVKKTDPESYYGVCECKSKGVGQECIARNDHGNHKELKTYDELYDITGLDATRYLLTTRNFFPLRFGGFTFGVNVSYVPEGYGLHKKPFTRLLATRHVSKVWYDNEAYHAPSIFLNALNNEILRGALRDRLNVSGNPGSYGITVINYPFSDTQQMITKENLLQSNDILIAVFIVVALAFVPSSFIYSLVYEKSTLSTHMEYLNGMPGTLYWTSNLVWHLLNYSLPALLSIGIIRVFNLPIYVSSENFLGISLLIILYGWACTPLTYLMSYLFTDASTAFLVLLVGNLFVSVSTVFTSFMLQVMNAETGDSNLEAVSEYIQYCFLIFPGFALGQGILHIVITTYTNEVYKLLGNEGKSISIFDFGFINSNLIVLSSVGLIAFLLTVLIDIWRHKQRRKSVKDAKPFSADDWESLDDDVVNEKSRVMDSSQPTDDVLVVRGITKTYAQNRKAQGSNTLVAVDHLSVGLKIGECFGLLGVNGAGKSTTFKILASLIMPTSGDVLLADRRIHDDQSALSLGYCPQFDALHDELTVDQHLTFYANVFGYHSDDITTLVRWLMHKMNLTQYRDSLASDLSGGTKRKLSTAIALLGDPQVVLFDEPSTGMDPKSRRFLWNTIRSLNKSGKTIMFTSHSMDECEELCHRIAIMVNGRLQCLGSSQHMKTKFANGYTIRLRLHKEATVPDRRSISDTVLHHFSNATLTDGSFAYTHMQFELNGSAVDISAVFSMCERLMETTVLSYSIVQNDLSNLFVSLAKQQSESNDPRLKPYVDAQPCPVAATSSIDVITES